MADKDDKKGFLLRVPASLLRDVRRWAEQDMRSINGQIEWILRDALRRRGWPAGDDEDDAPGDVPSPES